MDKPAEPVEVGGWIRREVFANGSFGQLSVWEEPATKKVIAVKVCIGCIGRFIICPLLTANFNISTAFYKEVLVVNDGNGVIYRLSTAELYILGRKASPAYDLICLLQHISLEALANRPVFSYEYILDI